GCQRNSPGARSSSGSGTSSTTGSRTGPGTGSVTGTGSAAAAPTGPGASTGAPIVATGGATRVVGPGASMATGSAAGGAGTGTVVLSVVDGAPRSMPAAMAGRVARAIASARVRRAGWPCRALRIAVSLSMGPTLGECP